MKMSSVNSTNNVSNLPLKIPKHKNIIISSKRIYIVDKISLWSFIYFWGNFPIFYQASSLIYGAFWQVILLVVVDSAVIPSANFNECTIDRK